MKIALEIGTPDWNSLSEFLRIQSAAEDPSSWGEALCVVAAYDHDTLIGVGKAASPNEMIFVIAPEYKHRDISVHMSKLLHHYQNHQPHTKGWKDISQTTAVS